MGAFWSCYTIGLKGVGVDGPAVWAVGNMGDCNKREMGMGRGWGSPTGQAEQLVQYKSV